MCALFRMREIISKENALYKHAYKLKDKRFRSETGEYLAEGERLVLDLFSYGFSSDIVYILAEKSMYDRHSTIFSSVSAYSIPAVLSEKLSETQNGQGVYAVVRKPLSKLPTCKNALFLDRVRDPGNLGTIIRTAAAFGFRDIIVYDCADPFSPKAVRSAMGCIPKVNLIEDMSVAQLKEYGYTFVCADMGGVPVERYSRPEKLCLAIGNEANGISDELRQAADGTVAVTMQDVESLNASVSAAILMYELIKQEN